MRKKQKAAAPVDEDTITEALGDSWEKWRIEDTTLFHRLGEFLGRSKQMQKFEAVGQYIYARRFAERCLAARKRRVNRGFSRRVSMLEQMTGTINEHGAQFIEDALESLSHQQQLIGKLWLEGMTAESIAHALELTVAEVTRNVQHIRQTIKDSASQSRRTK